MILKNDLIVKIKDYFGLNVYETKVWLALLGKGLASAGEIASISNVPRSRTYDVLESLEKKGFVITKIGKPVRYLGVKPKIILEKLKNNVRSDADEKIKILSNLIGTEEFKQLENLYTVGVSPVKREDLSTSIQGKSIISNHLTELINSATSEILFCMPAEEVKMKEKLFFEVFSSPKKRGVKIKGVLFGDSAIINSLKNYLKIDISKTSINSKFFIFDRKEILFYLSPQPTKDEQAIWINSEFFCEGFCKLFEIATKNN